MDWLQYIPKNQIYAASDGLNTISYVLDKNNKSQYRLLYASSENLDSFINSINIVSFDKASGKKVLEQKLPNNDKILLVREYTLWNEDGTFVIVGKKGLLGKSSSILKYKF